MMRANRRADARRVELDDFDDGGNDDDELLLDFDEYFALKLYNRQLRNLKLK